MISIKSLFALRTIVILLITINFSLAEEENIEEEMNESNKMNIWKKSNNFVADFYENCIHLANDNSIIISPVSIHTCLALLYAGTNGETSEQLAKGLSFDTDLEKDLIINNYEKLLKEYQNDDSLINIANAIYFDEKIDINPDYKSLAINKFYSTIKSIDFSDSEKSTNIINSWVKEKTKNKIEKILNENDLKPDTKIVMMNAIHFDGKWYAPFNENLTKSEDFWLNDEKSVKVDMMWHRKANNKLKIKVIHDIPELDSSAVELPYDKSNLSMVIILPNKKTGLKNLEENLKGDQLNKIFDNFNFIRNPFSLKIPKFKVEYEVNLKEPLVKMGMDIIFSSRADFSNISSAPLQVSKAIHKAFITVDEKGTEAAATTALVITPRIFSSFEFHADHPFVYLIKDNNGQIFFMGRITGTNF